MSSVVYQFCSRACGCGSISETRGVSIAFDFSYSVIISGGSPTDIGFNLSVSSGWVHSPGQSLGISSKRLPTELGFDFWMLPGGREFDKGGDFVEIEMFCLSIGFISHKQRVSQKLVKIGEHYIVYFQFKLR